MVREVVGELARILASMRPFALALVGLPLCGGCGDCGPWDELPVEDPDGLATIEQLAAVEAAIDTFAGWTDRAETCVTEVRFVEDVEDAAGQYRDRHHRVELEPGAAKVTLHELCHAVDHEEGWISLENADVFTPYADMVDATRYPTADSRLLEAFAEICEDGPQVSALARALDAACGPDIVSPAFLLVDDVVFARGEALTFGTFTADATWTAVVGTERTGQPLGATLVAGAAGTFALDLAALPSDDGGPDHVEPELLRLEGAAVAERLALQPYSPAWDRNHALLGSSGDPLLVSLVDGAAWRVRSGPLALEPTTFPSFDPATSLSGFEHQGRAFVLGTRDGVVVIALADLGSGAVKPIGEGEPLRLHADADGAVAMFWSRGEAVLVGVDWGGVVRWRHALPGSDYLPRFLTRAADGGVLLVHRVRVPVDDGLDSNLLPMRLDPATGEWRVPEGGCGGFWKDEGWTRVGDGPEVVVSEGDGEAGYRLLLGEMTVAARP